MPTDDLKKLIIDLAKAQGVDPFLCLAIAGRESEYVNSKCRFEKNWSYLVMPEKYARALGITKDTETLLQSCSFTSMQIMGSVARELGFQGYLTDLNFPEIGLPFAIKKLRLLTKKFFTLEDAISSYNQGGPYKDAKGVYLNQPYVDNVKERLSKLRS